MRAVALLLAAASLGLAGCGGGEAEQDGRQPSEVVSSPGGTVDEGDEGTQSPGAVASPGSATARVDGRDFAWETVGTGCTIQEGEFSFGFSTSSDDTTLSGGGFFIDPGWGGQIVVRVPEPAGSEGITDYFIDLTAHGTSGLAISGSSLTYSGPFMKQPPQDGTNPAPVDAGEGTVGVTCPE